MATNPCNQTFGPCFDENDDNETVLKGADNPSSTTSLTCTGDGYDLKLVNGDREVSPASALAKGLKRTPAGQLYVPTPGMIMPVQSRANGAVYNMFLGSFQTIKAIDTFYSPMTFNNTSPYTAVIELDFLARMYWYIDPANTFGGMKMDVLIQKTTSLILPIPEPSWSTISTVSIGDARYDATSREYGTWIVPGTVTDQLAPGVKASYRMILNVGSDRAAGVSAIGDCTVYLTGKGLCLPPLV